MLILRDTSTWAGSLPQLSVIFLSPREKTSSGFIMCSLLVAFYAHTLSQMPRDPFLTPSAQSGNERKSESCTPADSERETGIVQCFLANALPILSSWPDCVNTEKSNALRLDASHPKTGAFTPSITIFLQPTHSQL